MAIPDPKHVKSVLKILGLFHHDDTTYRNSDFDHLAKFTCGGKHCVRNGFSHTDIYGAYWGLISQGAITLSMDSNYTLSRGPNYWEVRKQYENY